MLIPVLVLAAEIAAFYRYGGRQVAPVARGSFVDQIKDVILEEYFAAVIELRLRDVTRSIIAARADVFFWPNIRVVEPAAHAKDLAELHYLATCSEIMSVIMFLIDEAADSIEIHRDGVYMWSFGQAA
jgi:hypothetical protein